MSIEQWGSIQWTSMANAFEGCQNLNITNPAIDVPDLSGVTDMSKMFELAFAFNGPIGNWDVSTVENMSDMFSDALAFNQPIGDWEVGQVKDMSGMFLAAEAFNQPIGDWNVGNVETMSGMFATAESFNQPLGNWNVGNVETMQGMFSGAESFNQPLGNWDVSNVDDMSVMFSGASDFNQPIGNWNVEKVTDMLEMFESAVSFNQDIGNWDVGQVVDMRLMFENASAFDQDISSWQVGQVREMDWMFRGASLSTSNYDALLLGWSVQELQPNVVFDAGNSTYCIGESARAILLAAPNNWTITDAGPSADCNPVQVQLQVKVFLQGPFDGASGLMKDDLRAASVIPTAEPYTAMAGFTHVNGGGETVGASVLNVTGSDAVIDWVLLELRDANDPSIVLHTRAALLHSDGDVVDVAGGSTPVVFPLATPGAYHVSVRHRNHLGIRTASALTVGANTAYDFTTASSQAFGTEPMVQVGGSW
ncbi:MAG: BspA family leucine-rich repeat surface protein, partial [Bacteroidota bacterium]